MHPRSLIQTTIRGNHWCRPVLHPRLLHLQNQETSLQALNTLNTTRFNYRTRYAETTRHTNRTTGHGADGGHPVEFHCPKNVEASSDFIWPLTFPLVPLWRRPMCCNEKKNYSVHTLQSLISDWRTLMGVVYIGVCIQVGSLFYYGPGFHDRWIVLWAWRCNPSFCWARLNEVR